MSRDKWTISFALTVMLLTALSSSALSYATNQKHASAPIRLRVATFTPADGEQAHIPTQLTRTADDASDYYIVQFTDVVLPQWKSNLERMSVPVLDYIPDNAFKVRMTAAQATRVRAMSNVAWVGAFEPAYVLSPELATSGSQLVRVVVERGGDRQALLALATQLGVQVAEAGANSLLVAADRAQIEHLAIQGPDIAWIEPYTLPETCNEYGGGQIIGSGIANTTGYDGSTQIVAVADTGIGGGTAATAHRDIPTSRVAAIQNFPGAPDFCFESINNDGAVDVDSGHGTHVAGSVLSSGTPGTGVGKGVAPAAYLIFQAVENYAIPSDYCASEYGYINGYYFVGLNDLNAVYLQAYNANARIHANSWGSDVGGKYTEESAVTDNFIWNYKNMTITFAAGNAGEDYDFNGEVDSESIGSPATAKNVITIGASENDRQNHYECDTSLAYLSDDTGTTC
ncbi:MAG: S8 family serine peptidase, partial [Oscillochloris sp.]|nr:S8 family serine peptidase [Oscillochloris sp.]